MSKFIRYTCTKKNELTTREECEDCPEYNPCAKEGKWCFVGALTVEKDSRFVNDSLLPSAESSAMPIVRDISTVTIHIGEGQNFDIMRE